MWDLSTDGLFEHVRVRHGPPLCPALLPELCEVTLHERADVFEKETLQSESEILEPRQICDKELLQSEGDTQ